MPVRAILWIAAAAPANLRPGSVRIYREQHDKLPGMAGKVRIGVSGWRYAPWRGNFYPKGLPQARELAYAAQISPSTELNGSFLLPAASVELCNVGTADPSRLRVRGERQPLHHPHAQARTLGGLHPILARGDATRRRPPASAQPPSPRAARDVYCYFDNTDKLHAPDNALELVDMLRR